jgi:DNA-binding MarR family transcriptional regulator
MIDAKSAASAIALFCRLNTRARVTQPMTGGEIGLLVYLDSEETVHTSVAAASFFMLSKPAISRVVASLENKGLVTKRRSESDARVIELYVTDKGKEIIQIVLDSYEKRTANLRKKIGAAKFDQFIKTMNEANSIIAEELGL